MSELPHSPAAERNKQPILEVLQRVFPARGRVLEIAAGSGQHAVHFAAAMPGLDWLPSDRTEALPGLHARIEAEGPSNLRAPRALDVVADAWPDGPFDAAYSANSAHIMPWAAVESMFRGIAARLRDGAPFCLYGPFTFGGEHTAASNSAFERRLRAEAPHQGLRDVDALETLASGLQMVLDEAVPMPANNFTLVFRKEPA
ncbi:MAG: DUF938 domain-containing protein [Xanthomonadales bacterium]|nr:DUF938 domain-containing protein [Xanthomonadales bacterium]